MFGLKFTTMHCGDVIVCEYKNTKNITVVFIDTGTILKTTKRVLTGSDRPRLRDLLAKSVFGIGCIGIGKHKAHEGPADTKPFSIWRAMLRRCYYKPERTAWREGCTVIDEWLNFQVFAEWFEQKYPKDGDNYQLDKDINIPGNKRYSPEACCFVTQQENLAARQGSNKDTRGARLQADADQRADALSLPRITG